MKNFIVMQGQTYNEEKQLSILWSPQLTKNGKKNHAYERMKEITAGDRIFHFENGEIRAISTAIADCSESNQPQSLKKTGMWDDKGYLVKLQFRELDKPIKVLDIWEEMKPYRPQKYSAFQENGKGNQAYLFPCNDSWANIILKYT